MQSPEILKELTAIKTGRSAV